jgi:AcrR family transcriptional regulator
VRSGETRARLIQTAIKVFAAVGFDAASTRQLADDAGVSLAAISYHFGGKAELFEAAAEAIADYCRTLMGDVAGQLETDAPSDPVQRMERAASAYFRVLAGGSEPQAWVDFLVRCGTDAPDTYDKIYAAAFGPLEAALATGLAEHLHSEPKDEEVRLRLGVVTAAIIAMRTNRPAFLRRLGWEGLSGGHFERLDAAIRSLVRSDFMLGPAVRRPGVPAKDLSNHT